MNNHSMVHDHMMMDSGAEHSMMDHSSMDHSSMDHSGVDHSGMDHFAMDHSAMDHSAMDHSMMKMYFHTGVEEVILFSQWKTTSWQGMLGSCFAVFFMAALYEGLKVGREILLQRSLSRKYTVSIPGEETQAMTGHREQVTTRPTILSCAHALQSILHIIQIVISYFLMLIFMTYNVWLCIAVALGAGVGYFVFSWRRALIVDVNEHCH